MMTPRHPTRGFTDGEQTTPPPIIGTEEIRSIARSEAVAVGNEAQKDCVERGPICGVWRAIDEMRGRMNTMEIKQAGEQGRVEGAMKAQTRTLAVIVAAVGALGLAAQIVGMLLRLQ